MNLALIFSDFVENAEKRCNFSKLVDLISNFIFTEPHTLRGQLATQPAVKPGTEATDGRDTKSTTHYNLF